MKVVIMSKLPYLCHFRAIVHVWNNIVEDVEDPGDEVLQLTTWVDSFEFRSKEQFEERKKILSLEDVHDKLYAKDYGKEIIDDSDIILGIIEKYIKPEGDKYYEIIGKIHLFSSQNYYGEWENEDDTSDVRIQEIIQEDVEQWAKKNGIKLR
jgi:hypothetical protein